MNFAGLGEDRGEVRRAVLGASVGRLERIRQAYDPEGLFESAARQL
jgi:FAD/FMN-containing dehydrogenase